MKPLLAVVFVYFVGALCVVSAQAPGGDGCPPDKPMAFCFVNPCTFNNCTNGTNCVADYCGGCFFRCEPACNPFMCALACEFGFEKDAKGCDICKCKEDPCKLIRCGNGDVCRNGQCVGPKCFYNNVTYNPGDSFNATDGCNTCFCSETGVAGCTRRACLPKTCTYNGQTFDSGTAFPSADGCNDCTCSDGLVGCTEKACVCPNGLTIFDCLVDPCTYTRCSTGQTCVSNYCGGCNAKCVKSDNCPRDKPPVYCFADPCSTRENKCPLGTKCVANYCGGCTSTCERECPLVKCIPCTTGYVYNNQGCQTCQCKDPSCENVKCGNNTVCKNSQCIAGCRYNGNVYAQGDSFPSDDGCNTCFCSGNGAVGCTKKACPCTPEKPYTNCSYNPCIAALCVQGSVCVPDYCGGCKANCVPISPTITCREGGNIYQVGETYKSADGCNDCQCTDSGFSICTPGACPPPCPVYKCRACPAGYIFDDKGCQTCQCVDPLCAGRRCRDGYFCSGNYCCPNFVLTARCADPCANKFCPWFTTCQRYCNCYAKCVSWLPWLRW